MRSEPFDRGAVTSVEMLYLAVAALVAVVFLSSLGRLHAAGVEVTNTAQAAARAASLEANPSSADVAAAAIVATSTLRSRCLGGARSAMSWTPSTTGAWQGGSVTVTVSCVVRTQSLTGLWVPGVHTLVMSDTQPVDRYQR